MAFNTNPGKQSFTTSANQTEFDFNFKIYEPTDIEVFKTPKNQDPNDETDKLVYPGDYTVTIDGDDGGKVILTTPSTLDDTVVLNRKLPLIRDTSYVTNGDLKAVTLNADQDYQTYLIIDANVSLKSAIRLPQSAVDVDPVLPNVRRPNSYIRWNVDGSGLENDETIPEAVIAAKDSEDAAKLSETNAKDSEDAAKLSETNAKDSEDAAKLSETNAKDSEDAAKLSETNAKDSEDAAKLSETNAKDSEDAAKLSETNAKDSEDAAKLSETNAKDSEDAAKLSETNAKDSEDAAKLSETNAKDSEDAAKLSETNAKDSEDAAKLSETNAKDSEDAAKLSETNAKDSEDAAKLSETNAKDSEDAAKLSETNAKDSEDVAKLSETNAKDSEDAAKLSETNAKDSEDAAKLSETNAKDSEDAAKLSETNAKDSEDVAKLSETNAKDSEDAAKLSETNAKDSEDAAKLSETNAKDSEDAAKLSETNAANSLDEFTDLYLGAKASNPTTDNDGDPLQVGALYLNTTDNAMKVWNGATWLLAYASIVPLPIGTILNGYTIFDNCIVAFGGEFNRANYPKLWAYLQANLSLVKTEAQWQTEATGNGGICGYFSSGNNSTTFRVPNLNKAFLRPDSRGVASFQKGTLVTWDVGSGSGVFGVRDSSGDISTTREIIGADSYNTNQYTSSSRNVHIVWEHSAGGANLPGASESGYTGVTRPKNIAILPLIVAK